VMITYPRKSPLTEVGRVSANTDSPRVYHFRLIPCVLLLLLLLYLLPLAVAVVAVATSFVLFGSIDDCFCDEHFPFSSFSFVHCWKVYCCVVVVVVVVCPSFVVSERVFE